MDLLLLWASVLGNVGVGVLRAFYCEQCIRDLESVGECYWSDDVALPPGNAWVPFFAANSTLQVTMESISLEKLDKFKDDVADRLQPWEETWGPLSRS